MRDRPADEQRAHPWAEDPDGDAVSFGSWLRQQREIRGISLREIASVSKISVRYLEALEASRFSVLPAPVFAKGFLRQYASYVGLDPDEVVNYYIVAQQEAAPEEETDTAGGSKLHASTHWAYGLFLTLGIVLLFSLVILLSYRAERGPQETETPPSIVAPVFETPPPLPPSTLAIETAPLVVTLDFLDSCWVEALVDGESRISELHVPGESLQLDAQASVTLTLGNAEAVRIQVNGEDYENPPGGVVRDLRIVLDETDEGLVDPSLEDETGEGPADPAPDDEAPEQVEAAPARLGEP